MNNNFKLQIAILIKNILVLALFVILAIVFNKWWICLISALFFSYIEKEENNDNRTTSNR